MHKDLGKDLGKGIATAAIWVAVGVVAALAPESVRDVAGTAGVVTVLMWIFA